MRSTQFKACYDLIWELLKTTKGQANRRRLRDLSLTLRQIETQIAQAQQAFVEYHAQHITTWATIADIATTPMAKAQTRKKGGRRERV